jgi:hypothetical protein
MSIFHRTAAGQQIIVMTTAGGMKTVQQFTTTQAGQQFYTTQQPGSFFVPERNKCLDSVAEPAPVLWCGSGYDNYGFKKVFCIKEYSVSVVIFSSIFLKH